MLTRKQSELLRFIHDRLQAEGVPPSFDEMKEALDLRSKSGIHRLIMALEERGFIKRLANRARAIEVLRLPESATVQAPARPRAFAPSVISGNLGRARPAASPPVMSSLLRISTFARNRTGIWSGASSLLWRQPPLVWSGLI